MCTSVFQRSIENRPPSREENEPCSKAGKREKDADNQEKHSATKPSYLQIETIKNALPIKIIGKMLTKQYLI
jgi:hypothetical protein